jgi:hypothetical protein
LYDLYASKIQENEKPSDAASFGTDVHALAAAYAQKSLVNTCTHEVTRAELALKHLLSDQMHTATQYTHKYVEYLESLTSYKQSNQIYIEKLLKLNHSEVEGTPDCIIINEETQTLHVIDLKTGYTPVNATDNTQLMLYALMAYYTYDNYPVTAIQLHIVQPSLDHIDTAEVTTQQLDDFYTQVLRTVAQAKANPAFTPSQEACQYCYFKTRCTAFRDDLTNKITKAMHYVQKQQEGVAVGLQDISNDEIACLLTHKKSLLDYLALVEQQALDRMQSGQTIKGFKLVHKATHRKWTSEQEAYKALSAHFLEDEIIEKSLISPAKADKLCRSHNVTLDDNLTIKPEGGYTLAQVTDRRREANTLKAEDFD